jgi:hypothetical protein
VDHNSGRQGLVFLAIPREGLRRKVICLLLRQVRLTVFLRDVGAATPNDDSLSALVENLSDACEEGALVETSVETYTYVAHREIC